MCFVRVDIPMGMPRFYPCNESDHMDEQPAPAAGLPRGGGCVPAAGMHKYACNA
jgi:hypothetical protein